MTRNLSVGNSRVNTVGIVTKVGSVLWWCHLFMNDLGEQGVLWRAVETLEDKFKFHSELSSSSLLDEAGSSSASWRGSNDVTSCVMSWEGDIWGLQRQITGYLLFYYMHLSDIGLRVNPLSKSVHTCLRPAQRLGWSLWWCHQLGWCKYHGEVLPCPCPPPPPQSGEHPPEKLGIL